MVELETELKSVVHCCDGSKLHLSVEVQLEKYVKDGERREQPLGLVGQE